MSPPNLHGNAYPSIIHHILQNGGTKNRPHQNPAGAYNKGRWEDPWKPGILIHAVYHIMNKGPCFKPHLDKEEEGKDPDQGPGIWTINHLRAQIRGPYFQQNSQAGDGGVGRDPAGGTSA